MTGLVHDGAVKCAGGCWTGRLSGTQKVVRPWLCTPLSTAPLHRRCRRDA